MNLLAFRKRLDALEAQPRPEARRSKAEMRRTLQFLASDAEVGNLYTEALAQTAKLTCWHTRFGWCNPCLDATPTVGTAWAAVGLRMAELESVHTQQHTGPIGATH